MKSSTCLKAILLGIILSAFMEIQVDANADGFGMEIDTSFLNVGEAPDSITGAFIDQDILTFEPTTADTFINPKLKDHIFRIEGEAYDKNDIEGTLVRNFNEQVKNGGSHIIIYVEKHIGRAGLMKLIGFLKDALTNSGIQVEGDLSKIVSWIIFGIS